MLFRSWYELRADDPNPRVYAAENASGGINAETGSAEDDEHRSGESSQDNGRPSNPADSLDCSILQSCILSPIFGIKDPRTDPRVSFVGGIGKIRGVITGVVLLRIIFVGLTVLGINSNLQYIIKGLIILVACSIDMRKYLVKK